MNELITEIEEDIRRERIDKLWHGFGKIMVGISVGIVLITIIIVVVQDHRRARSIEKTAQVIKGIDRLNIEDFKGAIPIFEPLAADGNSYYGLAMLRKAQAQAALGNETDAKKTYEMLASHDAVMGPLAKLLSYGPATQGELVPQPEKDAVFYYTQSEFRGWQLQQQGKKDAAADVFLALLKDPGTPSSMRDRMTEVLRYVAPEKLAIQNTKKENAGL